MTITQERQTDLTDFRDGLRAFLRRIADDFGAGARLSDEHQGCDRIASVEELREGHEDRVRLVRRLQAALYDAGYAWPSGPTDHGGRGLSAEHDLEVERLMNEMGFPSREALFVGLNIVAPAVRHHGGDELRARVLPALYRGDAIGCQLFSEPGAGSDLAGVSARAVRDGNDWIITGQKVWTSMAHLADLGEALVRTDPDAPKHAGLTMFIIDMDSPGVTVRPIRQITGGAAFNEVFLDEVRVPDANRIGGAGEGWRVAATSLGSERSSMSGSTGPVTPHVLDRLHGLTGRLAAEAGPVHHEQVARTVTAVAALRAAEELTEKSWSHTLAPISGSVLKMLMVRAVDEIGRLAQSVLGERIYFDSGEWDTYAWSEFVLGAPALHIAGGTDEIQLNVIAQRGLGLPRPPKNT
ncbi:alkylation response protein AidB-like acyl-CoA dehydrogenase [Spinactinospora alkalitolerans]|uniref:Alkylation response protein AidB-like acyl-CoA dehydrogenase n=1 Tax=Spinactinospora alkalitolerans TaxID=687207 RepID=A0A852TTR1_9ACTN|nr:acyl-CoA dehydrogenase family protein [Spinactinospora alkalitolerans]NYE47836.1 alkylation response protein AidB-like acyl-CoA dehydrogenase [Spinactinospora alkalitolerans]